MSLTVFESIVTAPVAPPIDAHEIPVKVDVVPVCLTAEFPTVKFLTVLFAILTLPVQPAATVIPIKILEPVAVARVSVQLMLLACVSEPIKLFTNVKLNPVPPVVILIPVRPEPTEAVVPLVVIEPILLF